MLTTEAVTGFASVADSVNRGEIMKIRILKNTIYKGKRVEKGETIVADDKDRDANYLVALGKAESAEKAKDEKKSES